MRKPDFIIAGTQKAGTTWLRDNLFAHPNITGPSKQVHYFDKYYGRGSGWYCRHFNFAPMNVLVGEKSTEYFDTRTAESVAKRIAHECPDTKIIIILREPIDRTFSALQHMVNTGNEPLPGDPNAVLFEDRERPDGEGFRYIERGFYARQLAAFYQHIPESQLLVLIFEEDIVNNPMQGVQRTLSFLGINPPDAVVDTSPTNARRLSRAGARLMQMFRGVPYARSLIWRLDQRTPFRRWRPEFTQETRSKLRDIFAPENEALYRMLGRRISSWEDK